MNPIFKRFKNIYIQNNNKYVRRVKNKLVRSLDIAPSHKSILHSVAKHCLRFKDSKAERPCAVTEGGVVSP